MIGKQVKGRGFRGVLNYLFNKEGAHRSFPEYAHVFMIRLS